MAVAFSIAAEVFGNAVSALALERAVGAGEALATHLVRSVRTVTVEIAAVAARNALAIRGAAEFRGRTLAVLVAAEFFVLIVTVGAIIFEIAGPAARNATLVLALEFGRFVTFRTLFRQFVRACKNKLKKKN